MLTVCLPAEPAAVAKSNIILDVKPWDDETDMAKLEQCVRSIEMDGLLWGACKWQIRLNQMRCVSRLTNSDCSCSIHQTNVHSNAYTADFS